eukprot:TRINITY_DN1343_c0_g2_i1.p1 TRINITY_DN1343_c0_g2~~TRINITY_DN1343_c0_g2_i1.p1  ORF type:complete len:3127 (+),score=1111.21 TRINITY_DN1343_c0_g2_i1:70-9381(+)
MGQLERRICGLLAQGQRLRVSDAAAARRALSKALALLREATHEAVVACGMDETFAVGPDLWLYAAETAAALCDWEGVDRCVRQLSAAPPTRLPLLVRFHFVDGQSRARRGLGKDLVAGARVLLKGLSFPMTHLNRRTAFIVEVRPRGVLLDLEPPDDDHLFEREHLELVSEVGGALLDVLHQAMACIVKGIQIAQGDPSLAHLVVRGSELYWNLVRTSYHSGCRRELAPSMQKVVDALEHIGYEARDPQARAVWWLRLAMCRQEAEGDQPARDTVVRIAADAERRGLESLRYPLQRMRISLKAGGDAGKGGAGGDHERLINQGIAACQAVYAALGLPEDVQDRALAEAYTLVESAYQELARAAKGGGGDKKGAAGGAPAGGGKGVGGKEAGPVGGDGQRERDELLGELGLLAAMVGTDLAVWGTWRLQKPAAQFQDDPAADAPALFREYAGAVLRSRQGDGPGGVTAAHFADESGEVSLPGSKAAENLLPAIAVDVGGMKGEGGTAAGAGAAQARAKGHERERDVPARPARSLRARVYQEYAAALLLAHRAGGMAVQREPYSNRLTDPMQKQVAAAVRALEKALQSAARTGDMHLLQIGCILIWNLSLPLLNEAARRSVVKPMQSALLALEGCGANLHHLRVEMLHELACCDIADEFLQKANQRVTAALGIDYVVPPAVGGAHGSRPLDRFLRPLKERLDLKADIYYVPDRAAAEGNATECERVTREEVTLLVDQAQETKNPVELKQMLDRAIELMEGTEPVLRPEDLVPRVERAEEAPVDPKAKGKPAPKPGGKAAPAEDVPKKVPTPEELLLTDVLKRRAVLWGRVADLAWRGQSSRLVPTLRAAVKRLLCRQWTDPGDRDLRAAQVRGCLSYAHTYIVELGAFEGRGLRMGQRRFAAEGGDAPDESEERRLRDEVLKAQEGANQYVKRALEYARDLIQDGDRWLVVNAATKYYNWHAALFLENDLTQDQECAVSVPRDADMRHIETVIERELDVRSQPRQWHIVSVDHKELKSEMEVPGLVRDAEQDPVEITVRKPAAHPMCEVLGALYKELSDLKELRPPYRSVREGAHCTSQETLVLVGIADAYVRSLVQQYIRSKLDVASEEEVIAHSASASTFPIPAKPDDPDRLLERGFEVCRVMVGAFPCLMDARSFHTQMAVVRRLQLQKSPELEQVRPAGTPAPEAQERVMLSLELMRQRNVLTSFEDAKAGMVVRVTPRGFKPGTDYADVAPQGDVFTGTVVRKEESCVVMKWNDPDKGGPPAERAGKPFPRETSEPVSWWDSEACPRTDDDKEKLLRGAFNDLRENPNVELCARLADRALQSPAYAKVAVRVAGVAKELCHAGLLGVRQKRVRAAEPDAKGKGKDAKKDAGAASPGKPGGKDDGGPPPPKPGPTEWMWYSQCLQYAGQATMVLVNPKTQEKTTQNELRRRALDDFASAAEHALQGRADTTDDNLLQSVRLYHAAAQPFTRAAVTRGKMLSSLSRLMSPQVCGQLRLKDLPEEDHEAVLDLYLCLIQTYRDQTKWAEVEGAMRQAFEHLPRAQHKPLWEADVQFRCKKGQSALRVRDQLRGVKGYDAQTQARAWLMFARCTPQRADQLHALQQAVEALASDPGPQAAAITTLAMWMYRNRQPTGRCIEALLWAADKLADAVEMEEDLPLDDARSAQSGGSRSRIGSGMMSNSQSFQGGTRSERRGSAGVLSQTALSQAGDAGGPQQPGATLQELSVMASAFVRLATVAGSQHPDYHKYLQLAVHYYTCMLHTTARGLERIRAQERARQRRRKRRRPSADAASLAGGAEPEEPQQEVPRASFPQDAAGWVGWVMPERLVESLRRAPASPWVLAPGALEDPGFVLVTLRQLVERVRAEGMAIEVLPLLAVDELLAHAAPLHRCTRVRVLTRNALEWAAAHEALAVSALAAARGGLPPVHLDEGDRRELLEDLRQVLEQPPVAPERGAAAIEEVEGEADRLHAVWTDEAVLLVQQARLSEAKTLLREAAVHAAAWRDQPELARCRVVSAQIALLEGRQGDARELSDSALSIQDASGARLPAALVCELAALRAAIALGELGFDASRAVVEAAEERLLRCDELDGASDGARGALLCAWVEMLLQRQREEQAALLGTGLSAEQLDLLAEKAAAAVQLAGASRGAAVRGLQARCALLSYRLRRAPLCTADRAALLHSKELLVEQQGLLARAAAHADELCLAVAPRGHSLSRAAVSLPCRRLRSEVALLEGENALARAGVNRLLRRLYALAPSAEDMAPGAEVDLSRLPMYARRRGSADADTTQRVDRFMNAELGMRFMTSTAKQRRAAARRTALDARRARRLRELEDAWTPEPKVQQLTPPGTADSAAAQKGRGKGKPGTPAAPAPAAAEPAPEPAAVPEGPSDAQREKWQAQLLQELPSDDGEGTSSSDSEGEVARLEEAATGGAADRLVSPRDAASFFLGALAAAPEGSLLRARAQAGAGRCMRAEAEAAVDGELRRRLARRGLPPLTVSAASQLDELWNQPPPPALLVAMVEESDKAKKPPPKGAKKDEPPQAAPEPAGEEPPTVHRPPQHDPAAQARDLLSPALEAAMAADDWAPAAETAADLARVAVLQKDRGLAARCIALAQALSTADFARGVFRASSFCGAAERTMLAQLDLALSAHPQAAVGERFRRMQQAAYDASPMLRALRAWKGAGAVAAPAADALPGRCIMIVLYVGPARQHLYAAVLRPGCAACGLRRSALDAAALAQLIDDIAAIDEDRVSTLNGDVSDAAFVQGLAQRWDAVCERTAALLDEVLAPFAPLTARVPDGDPSPQVFLCASPALLPLPLEVHPVLREARAVSRSLSIWHVEMHHEAISAGERPKAELLRYCVDIYDECRGKLMGALLADRDRPPPSWDGLCGAPADGTTARQPSAAEIQKLLALQAGPKGEAPAGGAAPCAVVLAGRLGSSVDLRHLAGLDLAHHRALLLLDRAVNERSYRRESGQDTRKTPAQLQAEAPHRVAVLLMARGVTGLVINTHSGSVANNAAVARNLVGAVERGVPAPEWLHTLRRGPERRPSGEEAAAADEAAKGAKGAPAKGGKPEKGAPAAVEVAPELLALPAADRLNPVVWGIAP